MPDDDNPPSTPLPDHLERLGLWLGFWKFVLGSFVVAIITTVLNYQIQWRTIQVKAREQEKEYLKSFIDRAMEDNLEKRVRFAQYFAILLKEGWTDYFKQLDAELAAQKATVVTAKEEQKNLVASNDPQSQNRAEELARKISVIEANITPQVSAQQAIADEAWPFVVVPEGDDLIVNDVAARPFGFPWDPLDAGETASGTNLKVNQTIVGCALPMSGSKLSVLKGSPIPKLPWKTVVKITNLQTKKAIDAELIDLGPPKRSGYAIALTSAAFQALGGTSEPSLQVSYRIVGGARNMAAKP